VARWFAARGAQPTSERSSAAPSTANGAPGAPLHPTKRTETSENLRGLSMRGGAYLLVREVSGIAVRLAGIIFVTRLIGPYDYGLYASALAFVTVLASVAQLGVEVRLISDAEQPTERAYGTALTLLLVSSGVAIVVGLTGALVVLDSGHKVQFLAPFEVLLLSIPVNICWAPAQARLERGFQYRRLAYLELGGDVVLYGVSVSLALTGAGVWAPTIGYVAWQSFLFVGSLVAAGKAPRPAWELDEAQRMLRFGGGYGLVTLVGNLAGLINPIVVGHYAGPSGVGIVAVATRLATTVAFVNRAVWRLAVVALGRVQDDLARLRRGIEEAMAVQVIVLGPFLAGFAIASSVVVPAVFGHRWTRVIDLFPPIALGDLLMTALLVPQAVLYAKGHNRPVIVKQVFNLAVLALVASLLVPTLGLSGFGIAYIASSVPLLIVHFAARRIVFYRTARTLWWLAAFGPPIFFPLVQWPYRLVLLVPLGLVLLRPSARTELAGYVSEAWMLVIRRPT
jgi:O-antigen/teichoic acid export membrane protein